MKLKGMPLAFCIILSFALLTGCWSSREINTLAITICIGIDKTENGYLVTEQVLNPKAIASKRAMNETPVVLYTAAGKDLEETIRRITKQCPRTIYNSHLRLVVFGEELARNGIKDILDYIARNHEYRTDFYFVVAKGTTAHEILQALTPLDTIPGINMYNSLATSSENWAPTKSTRMVELVNSIVADGINPVLSGIEMAGAENKAESTDALKQNYLKETPIYKMLAVFKKDKLTGWLDEDQSRGYNFITGNVKKSAGYAYYGETARISYNIVGSQAAMKVSLANDGKPGMEVKIKVVFDVNAVEGQFDITSEENRESLVDIVESTVITYCEEAISAVKNNKTDIFGFGEAIHRKYPKLWEKMKDDWDNEFPDLQINIAVSAKLSQLGQITKSFFIEEKQ